MSNLKYKKVLINFFHMYFFEVILSYISILLSVAAYDGGISGCQLSWDVDDAF